MELMIYFTEEHILIRNSVRDWVQSFIMPQIDDAAQHHKDIPNLMKELGAIGALCPIFQKNMEVLV